MWLLDSVKIACVVNNSVPSFLHALESFEGPACAVIDLRMPGMSGLEVQKHLIDAGFDLPIMFLTAHGEVPAAVTAMQAGAIDFIQKPFNPDSFLTSVQRAMRLAGERYAKRAVDLELRRLVEQLSSRERDVLCGLLDGRTSKEIAIALDISRKTVDVHRANLSRKLHVTTHAELIRLFGRATDFLAGADQTRSRRRPL